MDVAKFPGLRQRPNSSNWYYIVRVPDDLRGAIRKSQIWVSLRTSSRKDAERAWIEKHAWWQDEFDRLRQEAAASRAEHEAGITVPVIQSRVERLRAIRRQRGTEGMRPLDEQTALKLARTWFVDAEQRALFEPAAISAEEGVSDRRIEIEILRDPTHPDCQVWTQRTADALLEERGYAGRPGEGGYSRLAEYLRRAMLEIARRDLDRLRGDFALATHDHLFAAHQPIEALPPAGRGTASATVREVADGFWGEKLAGKPVDAKTRQKYRAALDLVIAFLGEATPIAEVSREQCKRFLLLLRHLPPNYAKRRPDRGLPAIIEEAFAREGKGLSVASRMTYFQQFRDMVTWAAAEGHPVRCRIDDLRVERHVTDGDEGEDRRPFTAAELQKIFTAPLFTGCVDDERGFSRKGLNVVRRARYWVPLLALWTGARLAELCQLRVEDVRRTSGGLAFIEITDQGTGMSVKTKAARRCIPIHPELERLGFLDWVEQRRLVGEHQLFPEMLSPGRPNSYLASKRFASFLASLKLTGKDICFHSFRHGFRDAMRRARVSEDIAEALGGWSEGKKTSRTYGEGYLAETLFPDLKSISYPDLDLSHLYPLAVIGGAGANQ